MSDRYDRVPVASREQWRAWLTGHHAETDGVWVVTHKREGLVAPAGRAAVDRAKGDGTWTALDDVERLVEPSDLAQAIDADADARRHWDAFPPSTRRGILEWILSAKRPATRHHKRIGETVELAAQDIRANQWRQPEGRG